MGMAEAWIYKSTTELCKKGRWVAWTRPGVERWGGQDARSRNLGPVAVVQPPRFKGCVNLAVVKRPVAVAGFMQPFAKKCLCIQSSSTFSLWLSRLFWLKLVSYQRRPWPHWVPRCGCSPWRWWGTELCSWLDHRRYFRLCFLWKKVRGRLLCLITSCTQLTLFELVRHRSVIILLSDTRGVGR